MTTSSASRSGAVSDGRLRNDHIWRRAMGRTKTPQDVPVYRADLYSKAAIRDPYPHYATMRGLGSVVWLPKQRLYAIPRYAEVKEVLRDTDTFRSGGGVALNTISRTVGRRSLLMVDGAEHDRVRKLLAHRLIPRALRPLQNQIDDLAEKTVRAAVANVRVDGVGDIALRLPLSVVPDLVGWPEGDREHLVKWAGATFDLLGPFNSLAVRSSGKVLSMLAFVHRLARRRNVIPGSMAHEVVQAIEEGATSFGLHRLSGALHRHDGKCDCGGTLAVRYQPGSMAATAARPCPDTQCGKRSRPDGIRGQGVRTPRRA
jgi:cytochrome P450